LHLIYKSPSGETPGCSAAVHTKDKQLVVEKKIGNMSEKCVRPNEETEENKDSATR